MLTTLLPQLELKGTLAIPKTKLMFFFDYTDGGRSKIEPIGAKGACVQKKQKKTQHHKQRTLTDWVEP